MNNSMTILVTFADSWFYSEGGRHLQATNKIVAILGNQMGDSLKLIDRSTNQCKLSFSGDRNPEDLAKEIRETIHRELLNGDPQNVFTIVIDGRDYTYAGSASSASGNDSPVSSEKKTEPEKQIDRDALLRRRQERRRITESGADPEMAETLQEKLDKLVGAEEMKALCSDLKRIAPSLLAHNAAEIVRRRSYLFSVDPGCGYHTSLNLLSRTLRESGLMPDLDNIEEIMIPVDKKLTDDFDNFLDSFSNLLRSRSSKIIALDISNWLDRTGHPNFRKLLLLIEQYNKNKVVVFRMPYRSAATIETISRDLGDVVSLKSVVFRPFDTEQLHEVARRTLEKYNYKLAEASWPVFDKIISLEKADGYFYGVSTVKKIARDIIFDMHAWCLENGVESSEIPPEAITSFDLSESDDEPTLSDLDELVGMETVADRVRSILDQIAFAHASGMEAPAMHMAFVGNPGTGKTTVARIVGSVMKQRGYLRIGKFFEKHGRDLVGQYVGHTADITRQICEAAYGSVLFIDEAYSLASGTAGQADFGREALDMLIAQMENHRDDMIVILAGYPKEMEDLFAMNAGMRDRVRYVVEFPNYTREQLLEIFLRISRKHFKISEDYTEHAEQFFSSLPEKYITSRSFGNARFARNLYENAWAHAIRNIGNESTSDIVLTAEDFDAAAALADIPKEHNTDPIGFRT